MSKVDFCHCDCCDTDVIVEVGSAFCPVCGRFGFLADVEQDVDLSDKINNGWNWEEHALELLSNKFPDYEYLDAIEYWMNLATDAENLKMARQILCG